MGKCHAYRGNANISFRGKQSLKVWTGVIGPSFVMTGKHWAA